jgi:hypothetical protein
VNNTATGKPGDSFGRMGRCFRDFDNKLPQSFFRFPSELTFPNCNHTPPNLSQLRLLAAVSLDVCVELMLPTFGVVGWRRGVAASLMPVPETSMNEDSDPVLREYQVGRSGQVAGVQAVAETVRVQIPPDCHFWQGIPRPDA